MSITRLFTNGDDRFLVRIADTYDLDFLDGNDTLIVQAGTTTAHMGGGNDFVRVDAGAANLFGDTGADRFDLYASGVDVDGGDGNDIVNIRGGANHEAAGGLGDDRFNFLTGASGELLHGGEGDDLFLSYGRSIGGSIYGDAGNDRFYDFANVGGRTVTLYGGAGNDIYRVNSASGPSIVENAGEGSDTVQIAAGLSYTLGANLENLTVLGTAHPGTMSQLTGNSLANRIAGGADDEIISGAAGNDYLLGGDGRDDISGGSGNDRIVGGRGVDTIEGGAGADRFIYNSVNESPYNAAWDQDWITDWEAIDRIDLSAIDADPLAAGDQAFKITEIAFGYPAGPQPAGSVVLAGFGGDLAVLVYLAGGSSPDMVISLWSAGGEAALTSDNLIL